MPNQFRFDNRFLREFPALLHEQQQAPLEQPQLVIANQALLHELQLPVTAEQLPSTFGGNRQMPGSQPLAQKYAGHQFGHYNPYLGDGRGLLLGEWVTDQQRVDIHLKGAGPTPYSRGADGRAVLRSCIREFLGSEALYHLGIPTTRALSVVAGATVVQREQPEPGAMLARVARTHIRFGHFEHCYHRGLSNELTGLMNYVIETQWPDLAEQPETEFFERVVQSTAAMVAGWQAYGFNHGVMNTDNMSIVGETFDFGPFQFMDTYNPKLICNHSDHTGRYAFDQQPSIALWNLNCLALALSPLIESDALVAALKRFEGYLHRDYWALMAKRFGLTEVGTEDRQLMSEYLDILARQQRDFTLSMRALAEAPEQGVAELIDSDNSGELANWWQRYHSRWQADVLSAKQKQTQMLAANPRYILRNYLAQEAIVAAEQGDLSVLEDLYKTLQQPFTYQAERDRFAKVPPAWASELEISCSS
ncbi:hypothetical protein SAMN06297229_1125 [Pseudidiomarina planktonica]|uniref:Protein nucleotidyltransferase YdiU n=1 Tax=Pseudidiomarina planktonica TaxID=1323738 RepID=A0A1Y6EQA0_9GAMM|nr:YdiU family protein [Pseudidiomarina planktonica]RUO65466.1 YdiU family protein [Pseudidiomarina planktonica]SMQ64875.1 hypothetical protein SAMN06297229_1125 [Pseudidiomarina planktonica]